MQLAETMRAKKSFKRNFVFQKLVAVHQSYSVSESNAYNSVKWLEYTFLQATGYCFAWT